MGNYRLKHQFIRGEEKKENEYFYKFQKDAMKRSIDLMKQKIKWTIPINRDYSTDAFVVAISSPDEFNTFVIESLTFR